MAKKIKIGIITNEKNNFLWHYSVISTLIDSDFADVILNINYKDEDEEFQREEKNNKFPFFWKYLLKIENRLFKIKNNALDKKDLNKLTKNIPFFKINKNTESDTLKNWEIDVLINFTNIEPDKILVNSSKYGLWFLNHCDIEKINKRPYGIWEILKKSPETSAVLRYIKKGMNLPRTIDHTSICTDYASYKRSINNLFWQSTTLLTNNISLLAKNEKLFNEKLKKKENVFKNPNLTIPFQPPKNGILIKFITLLYFNKVINLIKSKFFFNQWAIIFFNTRNESDIYSFKNYSKLLPPKDRFWADPFLVKHNDKYYLFIEELIYKNKLGHLSVMEIDKEGNYTKPTKILEKNYHLSYPFIFKDNGNFYMIPETSNNNDIQLYKCIEFPLKWELEKILLNNVVAVDTSIYKSNDTYWMFTNIRTQKEGSKHVELFLYSSKNLITDDWVPHPLNPIIADIKKARPAGSLFILKNKLYRPSQNCSNYYGYGLNISEITNLSSNNYEEKLIHEIHPNWDKKVNSIHTFNFIDNFFVGDIKIKRNRFF